ncbi:NRDE family protein [uncultured Ferrimonas sp.]|uniref:NRDE family protein n=1 Tax=uncultured Ferrimonas sp. TaxID=432640 RepID=UPI00261EE55F|nr:NRDE family protein [uncultured Ferrimonas sp.]
MCICAWDWQPQQQTPLVLIANRDEFYQRPSQEPHFWPQQPRLFAGKDLQAGGSWMGASLGGKLALVTNFRAFPPKDAPRSRGDLIRDYLSSDINAVDFVAGLHGQDYQGYNLLLLDGGGLHYHSNRSDSTQPKIQTLSPGQYGLCNHLLDTPWPKLARLKQGFAQLRPHGSDPQLLALLHDRAQADPEQLPNTGLAQPMEQLLSSVFIQSEQYGTRNSTVLRLSHQGALSWYEQGHNANGSGAIRQHQLQLDWHGQ